MSCYQIFVSLNIYHLLQRLPIGLVQLIRCLIQRPIWQHSHRVLHKLMHKNLPISSHKGPIKGTQFIGDNRGTFCLSAILRFVGTGEDQKIFAKIIAFLLHKTLITPLFVRVSPRACLPLERSKPLATDNSKCNSLPGGHR